jgi:DNA-binding NarL/FixJ family response regulator
MEATGEELSALFENHDIDDSFLRDLLEGKKPWSAIPDERLAMIVANLFGRPPALIEAQKSEVLGLLAEGISVAQIARQFDTTRQTIMRIRAA